MCFCNRMFCSVSHCFVIYAQWIWMSLFFCFLSVSWFIVKFSFNGYGWVTARGTSVCLVSPSCTPSTFSESQHCRLLFAGWLSIHHRQFPCCNTPRELKKGRRGGGELNLPAVKRWLKQPANVKLKEVCRRQRDGERRAARKIESVLVVVKWKSWC